MAEKDFNSKRFIKDLLIIDILGKTNYENPKNIPQILKELQERWNKLFPNEPIHIEKNFTATIPRHVSDMNKTGVYDIRTHEVLQRGYYNAKVSADVKNFVFTPEEFAIIAMALYRTPSISKEETQKILKKFENLVNTANEPFKKFLQTHIKYCQELKRKNARNTLPILQDILYAIINGKKIQFKLYDPMSLSTPNSLPKFQKIRQNFKSDEEKSVARDKIYTASPYFPIFDNDECYLVVYCPNREDKDSFYNDRQLSHFKLSLIANLKVTNEDAVPIKEISDYIRYVLKSEQTFSPEKYLMTHFNMTSDVSEMIDVTIQFKRDFCYDLTMKFGTSLKYSPVQNIQRQNVSERKKPDLFQFQTIINVPDSNETYQWFMQHSDSIRVIGPHSVRQKLKKRLQRTLEMLESFNAA